VPFGRLAVEADVDPHGRVGEVRFTNVPAWVAATGIHVDAVGRWWTVDVSFGGAFYASVRAADGGFAIGASDLGELTAVGRAIKRAMDRHRSVMHPDDDRLSGCFGTIWWEDELPAPDELARVRQRNVTVFADGEVDRSPCGSGTSARLALLHHHGLLRTGELLRHEGIVGTAFTARVLSSVTGPEGRRAVVTQIGGRAHRTGSHEFTLDPADEIGLGFQLR
jgi:proline racemase